MRTLVLVGLLVGAGVLAAAANEKPTRAEAKKMVEAVAEKKAADCPECAAKDKEIRELQNQVLALKQHVDRQVQVLKDADRRIMYIRKQTVKMLAVIDP